MRDNELLLKLVNLLESSYRYIKLIYDPNEMLNVLSSKRIEYSELDGVYEHVESSIKIFQELVRVAKRSSCKQRNTAHYGVNLKIYREPTKASDTIIAELFRDFAKRIEGIKIEILKLPHNLHELVHEDEYIITVVPAHKCKLTIRKHFIPIALFEHTNKYVFPLIKERFPVIMGHPDYSFPAYNFVELRYRKLKDEYKLDISTDIVEEDVKNLDTSLLNAIKERIDSSEAFFTANKTHVNELVRNILENKILRKEPRYASFERKYFDVVVANKLLIEENPQLVIEIVSFSVAMLHYRKMWESSAFRAKIFEKQARSILKNYPQIEQMLRLLNED